MAEIRISPNQNQVAIRSSYPEESPLAYGVFDDTNGGHWVPADQVTDWPVLDIPAQTPTPAPAPAPAKATPDAVSAKAAPEEIPAKAGK